jgi:hypothetical protein
MELIRFLEKNVSQKLPFEIAENLADIPGSNCHKQLIWKLMKYSTDPIIKNLTIQRYLNYAPVTDHPDHYLTLNYNAKYDAHFLTLRFRDLLIVDLDDSNPEKIADQIHKHFPGELFALHQTGHNNFHLVLLSKTINHFELEAIRMRLQLGCDTDYGHISLYYGSTVRIVSKEADRPFDYQFVRWIGSGRANRRAQGLYRTLLEHIQAFGGHSIYSFRNDAHFRRTLYDLWRATIREKNGTLGLVQTFESAPCFLVENGGDVEYRPVSNDYLFPKRDILRFLKNKHSPYCHQDYTEELMDEAVRSSSFYWMLESGDDYAIGTDIPSNFWFIVYRNLLVVDYDHPSRIKILHEYCRLHPGSKFRVLPTPKGWHCFLTSHLMGFGEPRSRQLLERLSSDPLYIRCAVKKGYSVRLNKKTPEERCPTFHDSFTVGSGRELPRQLLLFRLFLAMANRCRGERPAGANQKNAFAILEERAKGPLVVGEGPPSSVACARPE